MRLLAFMALTLTFTIFKGMVLEESGVVELEFPEFNLPEAEFRDVSFGGCNPVVLCLDEVAKILYNIGVVGLFFVRLVIEGFTFNLAVLALMVKIAVTGFPGAPSWLNFLFYAIQFGGLAIGAYRLARSGDDNV